MINILKSFEGYIYDNLGVPVVLQNWRGDRQLPPFLRDIFSVFRCELLDSSYLLAVSKGDAEQTPASVRKHLDLLSEKWGMDAIYLSPSISAYNRKRLIQYKVPFVVPGNQMYLPLLGIDLREYIRKQRSSKSTKFSPSTQAVALYVLHNEVPGEETPSGLADKLGYSPMTLTRVFDELQSAGIGEVEMEGRERILRFNLDKMALWQNVQPYLRSPVKRRVFVQAEDSQCPGALAGLSALSRYSMLAEPRVPVYAFNTPEWKAYKSEAGVMELPFQEPGSFEIEIWSYSPQLLAQQGVVDRLSLYLSLRESTDERVESALEELLEGIEW